MGVPFGTGTTDCGGNGGCTGGGGACRTGGGNGLPNAKCITPTMPSGGNCCLAAGQKILLANGELKDSSEIVRGDEITGVQCCKNKASQLVTAIKSFEAECLRIVHERGQTICTRTHLLLNPNLDAVMASELNVGDLLLSSEFDEIKILKIEVDEVRDVFAFTCEPDHTFICDGIFHHNKPIPLDGDLIL